jgi:hypothetical protein
MLEPSEIETTGVPASLWEWSSVVKLEVTNDVRYDYVHFSVVESNTRGFDETESGEMSHVAFAHRFTKLGNMLLNRTAA